MRTVTKMAEHRYRTDFPNRTAARLPFKTRAQGNENWWVRRLISLLVLSAQVTQHALDHCKKAPNVQISRLKAILGEADRIATPSCSVLMARVPSGDHLIRVLKVTTP